MYRQEDPLISTQVLEVRAHIALGYRYGWERASACGAAEVEVAGSMEQRVRYIHVLATGSHMIGMYCISTLK